MASGRSQQRRHTHAGGAYRLRTVCPGEHRPTPRCAPCSVLALCRDDRRLKAQGNGDHGVGHTDGMVRVHQLPALVGAAEERGQARQQPYACGAVEGCLIHHPSQAVHNVGAGAARRQPDGARAQRGEQRCPGRVRGAVGEPLLRCAANESGAVGGVGEVFRGGISAPAERVEPAQIDGVQVV